MDEVRAASMAGVRTQSVLVVLFDGVQPLDIAGPVDVFSVAARYTGSEGTPPTSSAPPRSVARPYGPPGAFGWFPIWIWPMRRTRTSCSCPVGRAWGTSAAGL